MIYWKIIKLRFWFWLFWHTNNFNSWVDKQSESNFQDPSLSKYIDDWTGEYNGN